MGEIGAWLELSGKPIQRDATMTSWLSVVIILWMMTQFFLGNFMDNFLKLILVGFKYFEVRRCLCDTFCLQKWHNYFLPCFHAPLLYGFAIFFFFYQDMGTIFLSLFWIRPGMWLALTNVEVTLYRFWVWPSRELSSFFWNPTTAILEYGIERNHPRLS